MQITLIDLRRLAEQLNNQGTAIPEDRDAWYALLLKLLEEQQLGGLPTIGGGSSGGSAGGGG